MFTGQIQADYRDFLNRHDTTDVDTFLLRRARFGLEANLGNYYEFRLMPDFGMGFTRLQDAYLNIHYVDDIQITIGKFKQPISFEELITDRYVPLMERSIFDQLMPARDPGAMIHGQKLFGDRVDYAASLSNGGVNGVDAYGAPTDVSVDGHVDFNTRLVFRPFRGEGKDSALYHLQIGASGSVGKEGKGPFHRLCERLLPLNFSVSTPVFKPRGTGDASFPSFPTFIVDLGWPRSISTKMR